jgi:FAD/FMN-containing dehydrogenase
MTIFEFDTLGTTRFLLPGDDGYEEASTVSVRAGTPAVVAQPENAAEVAAAVRFAADNGLILSIRGGGHSGSGHSTNDGGLVIDLSRMNEMSVADDSLVTIGGGATWGAVADFLRPYELAISSGDTRSVGVGGLTLGGGVGWMVREHGLALDQLVEAEVVTAAGDVLTASDSQNDDLFWALRGGGGNFGVVTRFTFRAHDLAGVHFGALTFGDTDLATLLRGWRDAMREAPEKLNSTFLSMPAFGEDAPGGVTVLVNYAGLDDDHATAAIAPLLALDGLTSNSVQRTAYSELLSEPMHPPQGIRVANNNGFASDFSDEVVDALARAYAALPGSVLMIRYLRGSFNAVDPSATAFAFRDSETLVISAAFFPEDAPDSATDAYQAQWNTLLPYLQGIYGNFSALTSDLATPQMYPPPTLARLARIKAQYDPGDLFDQNHNIRPAADWR